MNLLHGQVTEGLHDFKLTGSETCRHFSYQLLSTKLEHNLYEIKITMSAEEAAIPSELTLSWTHPSIDIQNYWDPSSGRNKGLGGDLSPPLSSKATLYAPVVALFNAKGRNRMTFALSDALHASQMMAGLREETAEFVCFVRLFTEPSPPIQHYEVILRIDLRDMPYFETLEHVSKWWAGLSEYAPAPVPEPARLPMYSTWYSFHQQLDAGEIEKQCTLAKQLGCEAVIVDDGWQTTNNERGYAYCGDWEVSHERIPNMKEHVERVHRIGMKYILWYSVPFVGIHAKAWPVFKDKLLYIDEQLGAGTLDPRFPEVRDYLIGIYEKALVEWDLDGFKLDFVDNFDLPRGKEKELGGGRDYDSVQEAVDRLLTDVMERLRAIKPDIMIEFRQRYIGPLMRKYGNMFRVADCPNNASQNRIGSMDIRLLCGETAAHSDMMMWNVNESVERAALQFVNSLFCVPQVSVLLDVLPEEHRRMIHFWLQFWRTNRDVLLDGKLQPHHPELLYPLLVARNEEKWLAAVYGSCMTVPIPSDVQNQIFLMNGTLDERLVIECCEDMGKRVVTITDCCGSVRSESVLTLNQGFHVIAIPPAGVAFIKKQ